MTSIDAADTERRSCAAREPRASTAIHRCNFQPVGRDSLILSLLAVFIAAVLAIAGGPPAARAQSQEGGVTVLRGTPAPLPQETVPVPPTRRGPLIINGSTPPRAPPLPRPPLTSGDAMLTPIQLPKLTLDTVLGAGRKLSDDEALSFKAALVAADETRWDAARSLVPRATAPELGKLIDWLNFRNPRGDGSFAEITKFLRDNPDWPEESVLRRQAEDRIGPEIGATDVVAFFSRAPPQSSAGIMKRMAAVEKAARGLLPSVASESWRNGTFRPNDQLEFLNRYRQDLSPADHVARFDRLVREGKEQPARELLPLMPPDYLATAEARLAMLAKAPEAPTLLRGLSAERQQDARVGLEQIRYLLRTGDRAQAVQVLRQSRASADEDWWRVRHTLARNALRARQHKDAYDLAAAHGLTRGTGYAEAEFLAGWIALRFLEKPDIALRHFQSLDQNVSTPASKSRAAYWVGRTYEAQKNMTEALAWYDRAAQNGQTYYGQLAARKLPGGFARMPSDPATSDSEREAVGQRDIIAVVRYLDQVNEDDRARPFLVRLSRLVQTAGEVGLTARLALELGMPEVAVGIARRAVENGIVLFQTSFPVVDLGDTGPIERALVLALTRQESNFQVDARSPANALGLMQLIPTTAQAMATKLNLPFALDRLTRDPAYNVALGTRYLADQLQSFGGSYELALAAYNAGPGNVRDWLKAYGDPRGGKIDMVDWVELIDFNETRNYVQRVMEAAVVYRDRLAGSFETVTLATPR